MAINRHANKGKKLDDSTTKGGKSKSARGETVDFNLLRIKAQINNTPKSIDVVARERFIDKRRRRTSRKADEMLAQQAEAKRYAEEAIKLQQEQKAETETPEATIVPTITVDTNNVVTHESAETKTKPKYERKINK